MPIECPVQIAKLSTEQFRELDYLVMKHAFDSQNCLGRLADERIYQMDLTQRLLGSGIEVMREVPVHLSHGVFRKSLFLDVVVAEKAVYELKTVRAITDEHAGQLLTYLLLLDLSHGKLVNFRPRSVESRFVNSPFTTAERRAFGVDEGGYEGSRDFLDLVISLCRDWGTSLALSLYQEALVALLGGSERVEAMIPLERDRLALGNQRFQLVTADTAFRLTAMNGETSDYGSQLRRLFACSPLRSIHWVNIARHTVSLTTITNS